MKNIYKAIITVCCGVVLVLSTGCANQTPREKAPKSGQPNGAEVAASSVPLESLFVMTDGKKKSLAQILKDHNAKVAIIQLAGVLCGSCQVLGKALEKQLGARKDEDKPLHVFVVTDLEQDFSESEVKNFHKRISPSSVLVRDIDTKIWKKYGSDQNALSLRPVLVANQEKKGFIFNKEVEAEKLIELADTIADSPVSGGETEPKQPVVSKK